MQRCFGSSSPALGGGHGGHGKEAAHHDDHHDDHDDHDEHHEHHHEEPVEPETWLLENPDPAYPYTLLYDETLPVFTLEEVAKHNKREDCWVIVHGKVYNVTSYISQHPGGDVILANAGKDSTTLFDKSSMTASAWIVMKDYFIGYCNHTRRFDGFTRSNRKGSHYLGDYEI
eukprot:gene15306-18133_t